MAIYSIYRFTNLVNGKVYIGKTTRNPELRLQEHILDAVKGSNHLIHRAIRKYGIAVFEYQVIYNTFDEHYLNEAEQLFITEYRSYAKQYPEHGYNMVPGGEGWTSETARSLNIKKVLEGRHHFQGKAGSELSKRTNAEKIAAGTHHWQASDYGAKSSRQNQERIANGTHPFAGENGTKLNLKRIADGKHNLAGEAGSKFQRSKIADGSHHSQKVHTCPYCKRSGGGNRFKGIHFEKCKKRPEALS